MNSKVGEVAYWNNALTGVSEGDLPNAVELRLLHRTQDQLAAFAIGAIRANVELRADARAETDFNSEADLVQDALMNALKRLDLTQEQWSLVPGAMVAALETCEQVGEAIDRYRP